MVVSFCCKSCFCQVKSLMYILLYLFVVVKVVLFVHYNFCHNNTLKCLNVTVEKKPSPEPERKKEPLPETVSPTGTFFVCDMFCLITILVSLAHPNLNREP